jgi:tRNA(Ile)-lysidine synthase
MIDSCLQYINENKLFDKNSKILLALSGGVDSVCLADLLFRLGYNMEFAHCNFNLRGQESEDDQDFVEQLSLKYKTPFHTVSFDTIDYAKKNKISIQMAAREQRYYWLEKIRTNINADFIAVAHNLDDNIETFFINIIRGSGIKGMLAIQNKYHFIVRPLMFSTRNEIVAYVVSNDLKFREDSSNISDKYLRNNIRHNIIPLIKNINPSIGKTITKEISVLTNINSIYKSNVDHAIKDILETTEKGFKIHIKKINSLSPLKPYLYEIFSSYGFTDIESIYDILECSISGKKVFSNSHILLFDREYIFIENIEKKNNEEFQVPRDLSNIKRPLKINFSFSESVLINKEKNIACFDFDKLKFPLKIRKWQLGDKFCPLGMSSFKKLSDFFIDIKLDIFSKEKVFLLCSGMKIIWVVGYRIDDRFKVTSKTKKMYIANLLE